MSFFRSGAEIPEGGDTLTAEQKAVLDKLAAKTVDKGMTVPAILFLETIKPLNYITSQALVFFEPIVQAIFNFQDYENLRTALEKRETIEILLRKIEELDAVALRKEKAFKKWYRAERKNWKWYQRYLGVFRPKFEVPPEVLNPPEEPPADSVQK